MKNCKQYIVSAKKAVWDIVDIEGVSLFDVTLGFSSNSSCQTGLKFLLSEQPGIFQGIAFFPGENS